MAGRWDRLKSLRVWEANRKELLLPENWLEPEPGDDDAPPPPPARRSRFRRPRRPKSDKGG